MARAPQFDLCHLKAEHGSDAVNEALQICRQAELKASLSVSGERCRRHDARADERATQAAFQPNKLKRPRAPFSDGAASRSPPS